MGKPLAGCLLVVVDYTEDAGFSMFLAGVQITFILLHPSKVWQSQPDRGDATICFSMTDSNFQWWLN